jgi:hypothetical protein
LSRRLAAIEPASLSFFVTGSLLTATLQGADDHGVRIFVEQQICGSKNFGGQTCLWNRVFENDHLPANRAINPSDLAARNDHQIVASQVFAEEPT